MPMPGAAAPVAATYNRYVYGLAVFHARTRASVTAADLVSRLRVSPEIAQALLREMQVKGVVAPVLQAATGAVRAVSPTPSTARASAGKIGAVARQFLTSDAHKEPEEPDAVQMPPSPETPPSVSEDFEDGSP